MCKDPEIRLTTKNDKVARFTVAVDRDYDREKTDFINCVTFKGTAGFVESYFHQGDPILVSGRLEIQKYTDKDGNNRTAAEVLVDNVWFCGRKPDQKEAYERAASLEPVEDDGQLPF